MITGGRLLPTPGSSNKDYKRAPAFSSQRQKTFKHIPETTFLVYQQPPNLRQLIVRSSLNSTVLNGIYTVIPCRRDVKPVTVPGSN